MTPKYPTLFVNHGGGPMPLLGRQQNLVKHMKEVVTKYLPSKPTSIVVLSAHWEEQNPIHITASPNPPMLYDYYGFPPETYEYQYPAPGSPLLASKIQGLLNEKGVNAKLDTKRGYDHGVFIPLMLMFPDADIPVVAVSMDASLSADENIKIGAALEPLREEGVLILGSGYTFHNLPSFFHPSAQSKSASTKFNDWLKDTMLSKEYSGEERLAKLKQWDKAPGGRQCHPREEHLLPLFMTAAAAGVASKAELIFDVEASKEDHAVSGYLFT